MVKMGMIQEWLVNYVSATGYGEFSGGAFTNRANAVNAGN